MARCFLRYFVICFIAIMAFVLTINTLISLAFFELFVGRRFRIRLGPSSSEDKTNNGNNKKQKLEDFGYHNVKINSFDRLVLNGYVKIQDENALFAIVAHGFGSNALDMFRHSELLVNKGYNVLVPDLRGHGGSEGKNCGLSVLDSIDIESWVKWLKSNTQMKEYIALGLSLGGMTVLRYASEHSDGNLKAIITDSAPFALEPIAHRIYSWKVKYPWVFVRTFIDMLLRIKLGFHFKLTELGQRLKRISVPVLIIHGNNDGLIDIEYGKAISDSIVSYHEFHAFDSNHTEAIIDDYVKYKSVLYSFLDRAS